MSKSVANYGGYRLMCRMPVDTALRITTLRAVQACHGPVMRGKQTVELLQRAAADQSDRAVARRGNAV